MAEVLTAEAMRAAERAAIGSGRVTGRALMERAGQGTAEAIVQACPGGGTRSAIVLCGPGNNGGDGFVVARHLLAKGWRVDVFLWGDPARLPPDARHNHDLWRALGDVRPLEETGLRAALAAAAGRPVVVDALFGIGQRAPLDDVLAPVHRALDAGPAPFVVAVDVPTGRDTDSGAPLAGRPMRADLIVTFHAPKPLHDLPPLAEVPRMVVDIGLDPEEEA
ncbi:NAD(P)H-hydrate epimerase [Roseivivax isoporae]|uniref:NAD(P)H-hydrate epimerase n=1 Tax=Roseivivax isoporae TaxID=591206 RepID=UPI0004B0E2EA